MPKKSKEGSLQETQVKELVLQALETEIEAIVELRA